MALDLFHRITDDQVPAGSPKSTFLRDAEIIADVNATVDWLRNHSAIDGERIGMTGFCMGKFSHSAKIPPDWPSCTKQNVEVWLCRPSGRNSR